MDTSTDRVPEPQQERERNKQVVRRLIDEVLNQGNLGVIDELYTTRLARGARRWISPFRTSFPDVQMEIVDLIAEGDKVVGRFTCSGTHLGEWLGQAPTGRRFEGIDEVYIFRISEGKIAHAWGIEDTLKRLEQLGLR
jgi:predicted ester cyclase